MCFRTITDHLPFLSPTERGELQRLKQNLCPSDFTIVKRFYDVTGNTFAEAERNLEIEAAKIISMKTSSGKQLIGWTNCAITYRSTSTRFGGSEGRFIAYPVGLRPQAKATVTLPRWTGKERAITADREKWDDIVRKIDLHEQYHVCIALTGFNKIKMAFLGITGMGRTLEKAKADLDSKLPAEFKKLFDEISERQRSYDMETDHGSIDARQKDYDKQITQECRQCYLGK
jgi:predicted secreted Zn-dependent protease